MRSPSIETSYQRRWLVLAVLCSSLFIIVMANLALNVAIPSIGADLHASFTSLQWIVDAYALCFAGLLLPFGALGDRFGRKEALQVGLLIFVVASLLASIATDPNQLIAARAAMGVGAALVMPGTLSILAMVFPPAERPKAIGIWAAVAGASVGASILWSGFLLEHFSWGSVFVSQAVIAAIALAVGYPLLPTSKSASESPLDPVGAGLSIVAIVALVYGLIAAPDHGWAGSTVLVSLAISLIALVGFIAWERHHPAPMLDLHFFADRRFSLGCIAIAGAYLALFGTYFLLTQYLQLVRGYSPLVAGVSALPAGLAQLVVAYSSGALVRRFGARTVIGSGLLFCAAGLITMSQLQVHGSLWACEIGLTFIGLGIGLTMPPSTSAIISSLPPHKTGVGSAVNDLVRELGGAIGIALLGSVLAAKYRSHLAPALAGHAASVSSSARRGLAEALQAGDHRIAAAARTSFVSGWTLAFMVGAVIVLAVSAAVWIFLTGAGRTQTSLPVPATADAPVEAPA